VAAVLLWLRLPDQLPPSTGPSMLALWGMKLSSTATAREYLAPAAHAVLRLMDPKWKPPPKPQVDIPTEVPIKTPTRTAYRDQLFAAVNGRIWFKRQPGLNGTADEPWRLFGDGLPAAPDGRADFVRPSRIESLSADGDDLLAMDDHGRVWLCTTASQSVSSVDGWSDGWGFPGKRSMYFDGRAANARAWSIGRRAEDARWYEDAIGNRHHFGPMGTTTLYVLHQNGQELLMTDNGLPNDFSRELCGPDDGRFVAENLSASASAVMLIDRWGRVMTQFNDYDLNGGTPNFEYSYRSDVRPDDDGSSVFHERHSVLPPLGAVEMAAVRTAHRRRASEQADHRHPDRCRKRCSRAPHRGARFSWRGGGTSSNPSRPRIGAFTHRRRPESTTRSCWRPTTCDAADQDRQDSGAGLIRSNLPRGRSYRTQWKGTLASLPGTEVELDWNPYCSPGRLTFRRPGGSIETTLHTVDSVDARSTTEARL